MTLRIAWGITGGGDHLSESIAIMKALCAKHHPTVDVMLSKAAEIVVTRYNLLDEIKQSFNRVFIEVDSNTPFLVGPLQLGKYALLLICPATANTTAKIAHGIADSLLTNCVAQAVKARIPVYIFPVDQHPGEIVTELPNKRTIALRMRDVDVANAEKLKHMTGVTVLPSPKEMGWIFSKLS